MNHGDKLSCVDEAPYDLCCGNPLYRRLQKLVGNDKATMIVSPPPLFILKDRLSFDKPSDTKRHDRESFKPEDWMDWLEPRAAWQKLDNNNKHKTCDNSNTTAQIDDVPLLLLTRWFLIRIRFPKKHYRKESKY